MSVELTYAPVIVQAPESPPPPPVGALQAGILSNIVKTWPSVPVAKGDKVSFAEAIRRSPFAYVVKPVPPLEIPTVPVVLAKERFPVRSVIALFVI